ncbi:MAG: TonB-dependent receptor [Gammaproteobacteria bacterium]|nr:TonB-dependent receptor [Gammaproteobacteria bacterium]
MEREVPMAWINSTAVRQLLVSPLFLLLFAAYAHAQPQGEPEESGDEAPETIVVTASRIPVASEQAGASFTVLDEEYLDRRQALTVEELLRGTPGVAVSRSGVLGSLSQVRMRGAEANHTLVLMDGIEIGDPALGGELDFSHFLAANLRRIEIVRGPLSALWGSDAVAGAINLISTPEEFGRSLKTSAEAGQFNTRRGALNGSASGDGWGVGVSVDHLSSDGQNISRSGDEADGYRNNTGHVVARFDPSGRVSLRVIARRSQSESQYDATSFLSGVPADSDSSTKRTHTVAGLQGSATTSGGRWTHRASLTHTGSENHNFASGSEIGETSGDKLHLSYQSTFLLPRFARNNGDEGVSPSITVGLGHEREDYLQRAAASFFGDPNRDLSTRSTEALAEFRLDTRGDWAAAAALRFDRNSDYDDAVSWRVSVLKHLGLGTALHAAYGIGVKNPTFIERFGYFSNFIGNPDLIPESSRGWELGVRYGSRTGTLAGSITWFNERLEDEINGFVFDPSSGGFTAGNRPGTSLRRGLELQGQASILPRLTLYGAYTWLRSREPAPGDTMVQELRRPRHSGSLNAHYEIADPAIGINLHLAYTGEQPDIFYPPWPNPSRRVSLDSFLLASLTASWQSTSRVRWHIRAENLGDTRFEEVYGFRGPGRSIHLGVQFSFFEEADGN